MKVLNKAAKQGRLTDLTKCLKTQKFIVSTSKKDIYQRIRKDNIMFNKEQDGTYLIHMGINRHPGQEERRTVVVTSEKISWINFISTLHLSRRQKMLKNLLRR